MSKKPKATKKPRKPRSAFRDGYAIVNPYGDLWSPEIFDTPEKAMQYVADFWRGINKPASDLSRYSTVWARQRTSPVTTRASKPE